MHIIYILTKLELGGAQKVCLELIKGTENTKHSASLITGSQGALVRDVEAFDSVFLLKTFKREVSIKGLYSELKTFIDMIKIIRKIAQDKKDVVIHTHSTKAGITGRWAAFFARVKTRVHTIHGFAFNNHQRWLPWLSIVAVEFFTSLITTHFVCVSEQDRQKGIKLFPFFRKKSSIIRAAINQEQFFIPSRKATSNIKQQPPYVIGTISCFKPQKNLFDLLRAYKAVKTAVYNKTQEHVLLEIIGDGQLRKDIERWIKTYKLNDSITLHGWQKNVLPFLRRWHIFSLSSLWEGLPCSVIEARSQHVPVVAYNTGGIKEVIHHDQNGFLVPQGAWQELADKFEYLLLDKQCYQRLSFFNDDLTAFKNTTMIKQHHALYRNIL